MSRTAPSYLRPTAALIALTALAALAAQVHASIQSGMRPDIAVTEMARYFTVLTNALVAGTFGLIAYGTARPRTLWLASLTLSIALVGIVNHLLLRGLRELSGYALAADIGFHYVVPVMVVAWWVIYAPKSRLRLDHVPGLALWPAIYCAYALGRGVLDGQFPYPFLDPDTIGWSAVMGNLVGLGLALLSGGALMWLLARRLDR
ncbi:hypothetical protein HKCCE2091_11580 [Rhodobacterales bacterium HKCCE2091]|nr:hypothetical protein [Rhodobacterales bacterium HKCCE2091]